MVFRYSHHQILGSKFLRIHEPGNFRSSLSQSSSTSALFSSVFNHQDFVDVNLELFRSMGINIIIQSIRLDHFSSSNSGQRSTMVVERYHLPANTRVEGATAGIAGTASSRTTG